jgi:hypothetical protein
LKIGLDVQSNFKPGLDAPGRFCVYSEYVTFRDISQSWEAPMDTWLRKPTCSIFDLFTAIPAPLDEDFYGLEEQLAVELAEPLPEGLAQTTLPEVDPDEFEQLYGWFLA